MLYPPAPFIRLKDFAAKHTDNKESNVRMVESKRNGKTGWLLEALRSDGSVKEYSFTVDLMKAIQISVVF